MGSTLAVPIRKALEACLRHRLHGCLQRRWERQCGRCSPAEMIQIVHCQFTYSATSHGVAVVCCVCRYPLYNTPWYCIAARGVNSLQQVLRKVKKRQGIQASLPNFPRKPEPSTLTAVRLSVQPGLIRADRKPHMLQLSIRYRGASESDWPHNAHQKSAVHL